MFLHAIWIIFLVSAIYISRGIANAGTVHDCIQKRTLKTVDVTESHCSLSEEDVNLLCPRNNIIVLRSLQLAVKKQSVDCMKRVLGTEDGFCCKDQDVDVLYDAQCLQSHWNEEDTKHYQDFIVKALQTCMAKQTCTLSPDLFKNLQRKIPEKGPLKSEVYSSYFQISYQCIKDPTNPVQFCSPTSRQGKEIHFRGMKTRPTDNTTCTCSVSSHSGKPISVKAVDVRKTQNGLQVNNIHLDDVPLFGFNEILSGKEINISLKLGSENTYENAKLWLLVSAADGQDVNVTCSEGTSETKDSTTAPGLVSSVTQEAGFGIWPILYLLAGSCITCIIIACVLGIVCVCRNRKKKKRQRQGSSLPYPHDYLPQSFDPPYATVLDNTPKGKNIRVSRSVSSQTLQRTYSKPYPRPYPRSTSMRSLRDRPSMAPPPPPPNAPPRKFENTSQPYSHLSRTPGVSCDVSQLEAFLEGKEPVPSNELSNAGSFQGSVDVPRYESPSRFCPRSRLASDQSMRSNQMSIQGIESVPRSGTSSPHCFGSVFESETSVTESLLGKGETPPQTTTRDLLRDIEEVTQSLLLDHKEDENHNEFDIVVKPVMTRM